MKRLKCVTVAVLLLTVCALSGGCWNYIDVDTQFVVMGVVIDKEDGEFIIYAEISKAKGGANAELITRIVASRGATLFDAVRNSIVKVGAKPYWGHTMIYVISERVAKDGIADVLSLLSRQTQIRSDIFILICPNDAVKKIFMFEDPIHEDVSQHLHDLLESYNASGKIRRTPLFKVLQDLSSPEMSLMLPIITMEKAEIQQSQENDSTSEDDKSSGSQSEDETEEILVADGSAIFAKDKYIETLSEIETRSALILKEEINKNFVIAAEEKKDTPACAIEVIDSKLDIAPSLTEDKTLVFDIALHVEGDLVELLSEADYISDENKGKLEVVFEQMLRDELTALIAKAQSCGSDICGFGGITHRKLPSFWRAMPGTWDEIYQSARFNVTVSVDITNSSLSMNPIKVGR